MPEGTYAVVLSVPDEAALARESERLCAAGVPLVEIREPDAPHHGALMALGLRPARKEALRKLVSQLPLLK